MAFEIRSAEHQLGLGALHRVAAIAVAVLGIAIFIFSAQKLFAVSTISTNIATDGTVNVSSTLQATGATILYGALSVGGVTSTQNYNLLSSDGTLTSHGTSALPIDADDDLFVDGSLEVDGTLFLDNASSVSSTGVFAFGGGTILAYNAISDADGAASNADVAGDDDLFIEGALETNGIAYADAGVIAASSSFRSGVSMIGHLSASSTATIAGLTYLNSGYISSASSTVTGQLHVLNTVSASSSLTVAGLAYLNGGYITGASSTVGGMLYVLNHFSASSTATLAGLTYLNSGYISSASSTVTGQLHVLNTVSASSSLTVAGLAYLNGGFLSGASSTVAGQLHALGTVSASSSLTVAGLSYLNSGVISSASSTLSASTTVARGLNIGTRDQNNDTITEHLTNTASLDFAALAGNACQDLTIAVTGADTADTVTLGTPLSAISTSTITFAWVSSAGTVSVRSCNIDESVATGEPAAGLYRVDVWKHSNG